MSAQPRYEYVSVKEVARILNKSLQRAYDMAHEGILETVGWTVLRIGRRIWIGIPK